MAAATGVVVATVVVVAAGVVVAGVDVADDVPPPRSAAPEPSAPALSAGASSVATPSASAVATLSATPSPAVPQVEVPDRGSGDFDVVPVVPVGGETEASTEVTYTVEIEGALPFDPRVTAAQIDATLADARGWRGVDGSRFGRRTTAADLRILVASPDTTDELCAPLQTRGRVSCRNGDLVVLNAWRWANGSTGYRGDRRGYRRYLVNHEVGHALGREHVPCPSPGAPAPVMLQQTYGLQGCAANPWPTAGG